MHEAVISTGAAVLRPGPRPDGSFGPWWEALDPAGADLSRMEGASLLVDHLARSDFQVGVVETARMEAGKLVASLRFSKNPKAQELEADVRDRIRRQLSVGYGVQEWRRDSGRDEPVPTFTATRWQPLEVSLVAIGADPEARFRSSNTELEFRNMTLEASPQAPEHAPAAPASPDHTALERARVSGILLSCRAMKLEQAVADKMIADGTPLDQARAAMIDAVAARQDGTHIRSLNPLGSGTGIPTPEQRARIEGGADYDSPEAKREAITAALAHRLGAKELPDHARQYRGASFPDLCAVMVGARGVRVPLFATAKAKVDLARKHTTSDFPLILGTAIDRALAEPYEAARSELADLTQTKLVDDFRPRRMIRPTDFPQLQQVREMGEYEHGTVSESSETYTIAKYGRIFGWSWELAVNDDLNALEQIARTTGLAAANLEANLLGDLINANPALSDGTAVWHGNRANLQTAASALSATSLASAMVLLRRQKSPDQATFLGLRPAFLLVAPENERLARSLVSDEVAAVVVGESTAAFRGLTVLVDPRLPAAEWYLFPSVGQAPNIVLAKLSENNGGPVTETKAGFEVDEFQLKVRHVIGAAFIDFRAVKSTGAAS